MMSTFLTEDGVEVPAVTGDQMREVDRVAIEEIGLSLYQIMENAGRNLALSAIELVGANWRAQSIVVLAGTGHNGGGGICAARHLANHGGDVIVVVTDESRLAPVPAAQLRVYRATPGRSATVDDLAALDPALIVDAMIGYGLGGAPRSPARDMIEWSTERLVPKLSLDVPSGIDATTGEAPGVHVVANRTMTLALPKTGLDVPLAGELRLADIGIPAEVYQRVGIDVPTTIFGTDFVVALSREDVA